MTATLKILFLFLAASLANGVIPCHAQVSGRLGADVKSLSSVEAKKDSIPGGVRVTRIHAGGALSSQTNMREGFVITKIGKFPVTSTEGLKYALSRQKGQFVIQGIYPGSKQVYYYNIHDF